jgi:acyl-coenzyme A thioesterase PaaI-like protein
MARKSFVTSDPALQAIRERVLRGIANNRTPGLHFPGYFLDFEWGEIAIGRASVAIADGPHCHDAHGEVDIIALAILADTVLATSARPSLAPGARLATTHLEMQFTGTPATGRITSDGSLLGFSSGLTLRQALTTAQLYANHEIIAHASGGFAALDPPPGVTMAPLPWQHTELPQTTQVNEDDFEPHEKAIRAACDTALAAATPQAPFIRQFWGGVPRVSARGVSNRVTIGPHLGNRVGHVQGGITLGVAAVNACAAAPATMMLSNIAAWYISPGRGNALRIRSRVLHAGRTVAVVRTEIKSAQGDRVLEAVTHHVARRAARS